MERKGIFRSIIKWGMVAFLGFLFAKDFIDIPPTNDQYPLDTIMFERPKPTVYRVLIPLLARGLYSLGIPSDVSIMIVVFVSAIAAYWAIEKFFRGYLPSDTVEFYAFGCYGLIFVMLLNFRTYIDWASVFFFAYSFHLLETMLSTKYIHIKDSFMNGVRIKHLLIYLAIFPFAVLHRETSILLILLYFVYLWRRMTLLFLVYTVGLQAAVWLIVRIILSAIFANAGERSLYMFTYVMGTYLKDPMMIIPLLLLVGMCRVVYIRWNSYPHLLQSAFLLVPVQLLLHIVLGNPYEIRVLAESFPIVFLMTFLPHQSLQKRQEKLILCC